MTRYIEDTLQLLRTWINIRAKSFIKTSGNMKQKSIKVIGKRSIAQKSKGAVQRTLHTPKYTTFHLFCTLLFLSNLVFKFNSVDWHFFKIIFSFKILLCSYFPQKMLTFKITYKLLLSVSVINSIN